MSIFGHHREKRHYRGEPARVENYGLGMKSYVGPVSPIVPVYESTKARVSDADWGRSRLSVWQAASAEDIAAAWERLVGIPTKPDHPAVAEAMARHKAWAAK